MTTPIKKFTIFGERCSGTNYLEEVISQNFHLNFTSEYGNKHFFCFNDYKDKVTNNTLFIGIIRNPVYWLNSFSKELQHVPDVNKRSLKNFLFNEFYSVHNEPTSNNIQLQSILLNVNSTTAPSYAINRADLNYKTGRKYLNVFELRKQKNDYLMNVLPHKVPNYILINYEDLLYNFDKTLNNIKTQFNLIAKNDTFINVSKYKKSDTYTFVKQRQITFSPKVVDLIWSNVDVSQENQLGYFNLLNNATFREC
jgi:hypothetical protein